MSGTIGVDRRALREDYQDVLRSVLRADPELLVICNSRPDEADFSAAREAFLTGHNVLLVQRPDQAPADTKWLQKTVP